jgi:hypothetical membrane protein
VLLSLGGAAILLGFITAEALYPGVSTTHTNTVSHLGASEPPNSVVLQPSAAIFDITMLVTGAMIVAGAAYAYEPCGARPCSSRPPCWASARSALASSP